MSRFPRLPDEVNSVGNDEISIDGIVIDSAEHGGPQADASLGGGEQSAVAGGVGILASGEARGTPGLLACEAPCYAPPVHLPWGLPADGEEPS